ncbi:MAG: zinc-ribbon domain-containing protein [Candidatus Obscuribacterales bacterium]|nr:zinc-ribbon domain-containing protein [Steroidobacteraceae bacterium]
MLTQCPACETVFRVTSAILKMGHGQVRCGKCRTQFDAVEALLDETEEIATPSAEDEEEATPGIEAREQEFAEDVTLEGSRIEISGTYRVPPGLRAGASEQVVHEHTVIDRDVAESPLDDADASNQSVEETVIDASLDDDEPVAAAADHLLRDTQPGARTNETLPISQRLWRRHRAAEEASKRSAASNEIAAELNALTNETTPRAKQTRRWALLSIFFVMLFAVQGVHHYRDALIRHPKLGPTVTRIYRAIGISPRWDLNGYEVQQWGMTGNPLASDLLRVRAGVINIAPFAQPYPHIKLSMADRWGAPAGERIFKPQEYLPSDAPTDRLLASKQRTNVEILIVDPGSDAVSFHLNPCLEYEQGIACANE